MNVYILVGLLCLAFFGILLARPRYYATPIDAKDQTSLMNEVFKAAGIASLPQGVSARDITVETQRTTGEIEHVLTIRAHSAQSILSWIRTESAFKPENKKARANHTGAHDDVPPVTSDVSPSFYTYTLTPHSEALRTSATIDEQTKLIIIQAVWSAPL